MTARDDITFMKAALKEAQTAASKGEVPVGAVAVVNGEVIARAHNRIEIDTNAAAHAEMLVLKKTCEKLKRWRLDDVSIYVTLEPCPMCAMAMVLHRVKRCVFATPEPRTGAGGSFLNLLHHPQLNHQIEMKTGVCQYEAAALLKSFFTRKRSET